MLVIVKLLFLLNIKEKFSTIKNLILKNILNIILVSKNVS